jgi:D-glycero-D-manno-heptose 1,7-bisphosphate phosphatase
MLNQALFLDRDGVINYNYGHVHKIENFKFLPGIFNLTKFATGLNYKIIIITNQSGIGRGIYNENQFLRLTNWMVKRFEKNGSIIDGVYYCPYHPVHGVGEYRIDSDFRKPAPGMLLQAAKDHNIDLEKSIFIGDNVTDMMAGKNAGVKNLIYLYNEEPYNGVVNIKNIIDAIPYLLSLKTA